MFQIQAAKVDPINSKQPKKKCRSATKRKRNIKNNNRVADRNGSDNEYTWPGSLSDEDTEQNHSLDGSHTYVLKIFICVFFLQTQIDIISTFLCLVLI